MTNQQGWDEVMKSVDRHERTMTICNRLFTDKVRINMKDLSDMEKGYVYDHL
jgi:hypothetical protein